MKKSRFFRDKESLPSLKPISSKTIESDQEKEKESFFSQQQEKKMEKGVFLTKNDMMPIMNDVKRKIIDEILGKMHEKHDETKKPFKNNNYGTQNFANYQNYLNYFYYHNPAVYNQFIDDYNKRYYHHILKNFGLPDKEYEKSESLDI